MTTQDFSLPPQQGFVVTHFLTVADVERSADFYARVLDGKIQRHGERTIVQVANSWIILNVGGAPTTDKPTVTLHPPTNLTKQPVS
jgi:lactoylglutathione lyase